jgi:flagellar hook-associated protein 3 FlgL
MRVSQQMLFTHYVSNLGQSLSDLMELNTKAQTQKRVNKPSDDPAGTTQILSSRDTLQRFDQYQKNIDTATGWLSTSDQALSQVSTLLTRATELAEQGATGTLSAANREQISYELRSIFEQLVGLANTTYEDKSIYAGQKNTGNAFEQIMWLTSNDRNFNESTNFSIEGSYAKTVLVQFTNDTAASGQSVALSDAATHVRYSIDGGATFLSDASVVHTSGGLQVVLPRAGVSMDLDNASVMVKASSRTDTNDTAGTWLWLRPSARYLGDDQDSVSVQMLGGGSTLRASASGNFPKDVAVRIDNAGAVTIGTDEIEYSYSFDGGLNWVTGNTVSPSGIASNVSLSVPGQGLLTLFSNGGNTIAAGSQFVVHPRTASLSVDISISEKVRLNDVGKDIFGGVFQDPTKLLAAQGARITFSSSNAAPVFSNASMAATLFVASNSSASTKNLFETLGNLIGFLETNNQTGVQRALENLKQVRNHVMSKAADVGSRENRLQTAGNILDGLKLNENDRLSAIEDVDVAELMTQVAQKQTVYEAVLRTTSLIMNMNLLKYI